MTTPQIPLAVPYVHLNGDRAETLIDRLLAAYEAVTAAMDALRECRPNGRNAYPVDGLMEQLETQHRTRQEYLQAVLDSLEAEIDGLTDTRAPR
jgi:hypothetical protein